jgi:membrane peptidoglycan carboxypeptidase
MKKFMILCFSLLLFITAANAFGRSTVAIDHPGYRVTNTIDRNAQQAVINHLALVKEYNVQYIQKFVDPGFSTLKVLFSPYIANIGYRQNETTFKFNQCPVKNQSHIYALNENRKTLLIFHRTNFVLLE